MTAARTVAQVEKAIGHPHVTLHREDGYLYFVYDDVATDRFDTRSVMVCYLKHLPLERWVEEARELIAKMEQAK